MTLNKNMEAGPVHKQEAITMQLNLLGCMVSKPSLFDAAILNGVGEGRFDGEYEKALFRSIAVARLKGGSWTTIESLGELLKDSPEYETFGGVAGITALIFNVPNIEDFDQYLHAVMGGQWKDIPTVESKKSPARSIGDLPAFGSEGMTYRMWLIGRCVQDVHEVMSVEGSAKRAVAVAREIIKILDDEAKANPPVPLPPIPPATKGQTRS